MRINNEDFYIQLVPDLDKNKNWLGTLQVQIFHLCQLISSVVPYMDDNPDIIAELEKYMKVEQKSNKSTKKIVSKQGNVINLNFKSKTNGSA